MYSNTSWIADGRYSHIGVHKEELKMNFLASLLAIYSLTTALVAATGAVSKSTGPPAFFLQVKIWIMNVYIQRVVELTVLKTTIY